MHEVGTGTGTAPRQHRPLRRRRLATGDGLALVV